MYSRDVLYNSRKVTRGTYTSTRFKDQARLKLINKRAAVRCSVRDNTIICVAYYYSRMFIPFVGTV